MKAQVLVFAAIVLLVSASLPKNDEELRSSFEDFVSKYDKKYSTPQEYLNRMEVYRQNLQIIDKLNQENSATFAVNRFADLSPSEFKARYLNYKPNQNRPAQIDLWTPTDKDLEATPKSFDWRTKGAVTKVKDQGQCGSCWAFSTAEEVESMWFLAGNKITELSPQQIVSCDKGNGDQGCGGGDTVTAYAYVKSKGLESEAAYPYTSGDSGDDGTCKYSASKVVAHISGFTYATPPCKDSCTKQNETILEAALAAKGPVSICVYAASWQFYSSGIFRSSCPRDYSELDHCVQLVGYDKTGKIPYWMVRNSWADTWGIEGYIHLEYGKNLCGVADEATFATIPKGFVDHQVISQN